MALLLAEPASEGGTAAAAASILDSRYSWGRLFVTWCIGVLGNAGMWSFVAIMPAVQVEFETDRAGVSVPYTLTMLGFALGSFAFGKAMDRFGVGKVLIGAALLIGAGFLIGTFASSLALLSLTQFAVGLGTAVSFAPLVADISHFFDKRRGIAMAVAASGNYCAGALWPLVLAGTLEAHGWRTVHRVLAVIVAGGIPPLTLLLRRQIPAEDKAKADTASSANAGSLQLSPTALTWLLSAASVSCCMAMSMPQVHLVSLCVDFGFGAAAGSRMLSALLVGGVISRLVSGMLADALGGVKTLLIGSSLQCLGLVLFVVYITYFEHTETPLYFVSLTFGLSQGGIIPSYAIVVREFMPAADAGARVGFVIGASIVGMAMGGLAAGWIFSLAGSYLWAFLHAIGWNVVNIAIMSGLVLCRRRAKGAGAAVAAPDVEAKP